jgi:hypothetical protein
MGRIYGGIAGGRDTPDKARLRAILFHIFQAVQQRLKQPLLLKKWTSLFVGLAIRYPW